MVVGRGVPGIWSGGEQVSAGNGKSPDGYDVEGRQGEDRIGRIQADYRGEGQYESEFWCTGEGVVSDSGEVWQCE